MAPPPPWTVRLDAVLWLHRAGPAARAALPAALRDRAAAGLTLGAVLRYADTPVGPYTELLASPRLVRGGWFRLHVPLIAVDSAASVDAGRAHWALPKTTAAFTSAPREGAALVVNGPGWRLGVQARGLGPWLPALGRVSVAQVWSDGAVRSFAVRLRGRARLARVAVETDAGAPFGAWLRPGRHVGLLLRDARMRLGPART